MKEDFSRLHLDNQLCFPLYAASRLTIQLYNPFLNELDITYPQYLVLLVLWEHGEQSVNEIGNHLILESNTLTPLLKRLEEKKLITRERSKSDERSVIIGLTEKSLLMKKDAALIPDKIINALKVCSLSLPEIIQFKEILSKLIRTLARN